MRVVLAVTILPSLSPRKTSKVMDILFIKGRFDRSRKVSVRDVGMVFRELIGRISQIRAKRKRIS